MNGLEAIELMKQGKMIESDDHFPHFIDPTTGKVLVWIAGNASPTTSFEINYEGYREYVEPKPLTGWERAQLDERYYTMTNKGVSEWKEDNHESDDRNFERANHFSTKEKAEEINFKQTLFRKLQRFSDENGGNEIDWKDKPQNKYAVLYSHVNRKFIVTSCWQSQNFGQVYFISEEVANKAIELFHDDLIKYFTGDFGGEA